jgi:histidyl-tRNA synthetase
MKLIEELRWAGLAVDYSLTPAKPDKQFKRAQELKARHIIKLERGENGEPLVRLRDIKTRNEMVASPADAASRLKQACSPSN